MDGLDPATHSVLGIALSMLLVFRTNTSYNRFWEARSHWGMLINTCRNLVRLGAQAAPPADDLARLVTAYAILLKEQLRDHRDLTCIRHLVPGRIFDRLQGVGNPAQVLAGYLTDWVLSRQAEGPARWSCWPSKWKGLIDTLVDCQGGCEKIHRTPLPFVYAALMKQVLFVYLLSLPLVLVPRMDYMGPLLVGVVSLGLAGHRGGGCRTRGSLWPGSQSFAPGCDLRDDRPRPGRSDQERAPGLTEFNSPISVFPQEETVFPCSLPRNSPRMLHTQAFRFIAGSRHTRIDIDVDYPCRCGGSRGLFRRPG